MPGGSFGDSAGFSSFNEPAAFSPVSQSAAPSPYPPAPTSFSAFDTSAGEGTVEQRIARLRQLLDKGILTESEFEAKHSRSSAGSDRGPRRSGAHL